MGVCPGQGRGEKHRIFSSIWFGFGIGVLLASGKSKQLKNWGFFHFFSEGIVLNACRSRSSNLEVPCAKIPPSSHWELNPRKQVHGCEMMWIDCNLPANHAVFTVNISIKPNRRKPSENMKITSKKDPLRQGISSIWFLPPCTHDFATSILFNYWVSSIHGGWSIINAFMIGFCTIISKEPPQIKGVYIYIFIFLIRHDQAYPLVSGLRILWLVDDFFLPSESEHLIAMPLRAADAFACSFLRCTITSKNKGVFAWVSCAVS